MSGENLWRGRHKIKLNFGEGKRKVALKRWKRNRSARIRILEHERKELKTKLKSTKKSIQRLRKKTMPKTVTDLTPNKQTEKDKSEENLTSFQREKPKKSYLPGIVLIDEIKQTKNKTPRSKVKAFHLIISGQITKKYKCIRQFSTKTG